ncbi:MAG TPA: hypothetical protein VFK80_05940, partial [Limnochordia bacterium]|nr:hypothetical protein [Limnochordia bacterium]
MVPLNAAPAGGGRPQEPKRAGTVRTAVRFIAWAISLDPRRMGFLLGLSLLGSLVPGATVYMVQGVLHAAQRLYAGQAAVGSLYAWLGLWAGLTFFTSGILAPARTLFSERLRQELTASTHRQLFAKTQRLCLEVFERPDFHDLVQRAQEAAGPGRFTFLLWEVIGMLQAPLTIASVAAIVGLQSPFVLVALLLVSLPAPIAQIVQGRQAFRLQRAQTDDERLRGYLAQVLTTPAAAKEVRTYGLARLLLDGWSRLQAQVADRIFRQQSRHQGLRAALNALGVAGLAGGVLWSAWALALGKLSPPQFAGMLVAMQAVRGGVGTLVGRYDWVSRNMLKVADLFVF